MKRILSFLICSFVIIFLIAPLSHAERAIRVKGERLALLIGNATYTHGGSLRNPINDARDMKVVLESLGFTVRKHVNCSQKKMKKAIDDFGGELKKYDVGLFFYAGHGLQVNGNNYLIPVDAKMENEHDAEYDCVRADRVLAKMEAAGSKTNIVILDACRDNPFERSWRRGTRGQGLAFMNAPSGSLIAYATSPGNTASDGPGTNGLYTSAMLENIITPGISIETMFKRVRSAVMAKTNNQQIPWESTSLRGDFYFNPQKTALPAAPSQEQIELSHGDVELQKERQRLERERQELESLKAEIERKKLEAEKQKLEIAKLPPEQRYRPFVSKANEIARDGSFIAYDDRTVLDMRTGLMWTATGNGKDINWHYAKGYCENFKGGGYDDWRMPTLEELAGLFGTGRGSTQLTRLIKLTGTPWASDARGDMAAVLSFTNGKEYWFIKSNEFTIRALPVRDANR